MQDKARERAKNAHSIRDSLTGWEGMVGPGGPGLGPQRALRGERRHLPGHAGLLHHHRPPDVPRGDPLFFNQSEPVLGVWGGGLNVG